MRAQRRFAEGALMIQRYRLYGDVARRHVYVAERAGRCYYAVTPVCHWRHFVDVYTYTYYCSLRFELLCHTLPIAGER